MPVAASLLTVNQNPPALDPASTGELRDAFAGWTVDSVGEVVGDRAMRALDREQVVPARVAAQAAGDEPVAVLSRLFMLGDEVPRAVAELVLGRSAGRRLGGDGRVAAGVPAGAGADTDIDGPSPATSGAGSATAANAVDRLVAGGLLEAAGARGDDPVRAVVDLRPYSATTADGQVDWWIASDPGEAVTGAAVLREHVLGVGGASSTLASITMRQPRSRVLDLGTGCGIQAMHASLHADTVVATDISQRALSFARFNEQLNAPALGPGEPAGGAKRPGGREPWDLRKGSLLEPVAAEEFDLVVSNPPFVITPAGAPSFEYRDGGLGGDGVAAALMSGVGSVLAPGGVAQFLANWEIRAGVAGEGDWRARLERWLDASPVPLDAWIVQRDVLDAAEYAETWLRDAGITAERDAALWTRSYETYLSAFDASGVEAIGFGMVVLRRPLSGQPTLRRLEEHEGALATPLGPTLAASLAAHDWLAGTSDEALLDTAFTVAPDVTKETYGRPLLSDPEHILIRQGGGFGRSVRADTALAGLVGACDGELTTGQIGHALAALLDVPAGVMLDGLVPAVRDLVRDGFLTH